MTATAAALGQAAKSDVTKGLLTRVLGPAADEIGMALARWTAFRVGNVKRIVEGADTKATRSGRTGTVPPRVAHRILEEGSYCDDPVMVDYLSGVLASGRTPSGRDDRAVVWSNLVTGMSAVQVRAHYLLYREWSLLLSDHPPINLGARSGREQATLCLPLTAFIEGVFDDLDELNSRLGHVVSGLERLGLIDPGFHAGTREESPVPNAPFDHIFVAIPSVAGIELFGWGQGFAGFDPSDFGQASHDFALNPPLPRLAHAYLPRFESINTEGATTDDGEQQSQA